MKLASLCHSRVRSSRDIVAKSLEGDYRPEHVFALRLSLAGYRYYQGLIAEVDQEIQRNLAELKSAADPDSKPPKRTKKRPHQRQLPRPASIYRLSCIEFSASTSPMFLGLVLLLPTQSSARSAHTFLDSGMHPHSRRGWGYVRSNRSAGDEFSIRRVDASEIVLRWRYGSEQTLYIMPKITWANSSGKSPRKLGKPQAITATAHKLARIVFHLLHTKEPYDETVFQRSDHDALKRAELRLRRYAAQLGFQVVPDTNS